MVIVLLTFGGVIEAPIIIVHIIEPPRVAVSIHVWNGSAEWRRNIYANKMYDTDVRWASSTDYCWCWYVIERIV